MKKYIVEMTYQTSEGSELLEYWEMTRERITHEDFRTIIISMFDYGADSYIYHDITTCVKCEGKELLTVQCSTKVDCGEIYSDIIATRPGKDFMHVRRMTVAA